MLYPKPDESRPLKEPMFAVLTIVCMPYFKFEVQRNGLAASPVQ